MKSKPPPKKKPAQSPDPGERLNRYLARCGLCSRREADRWIAAGRVCINGKAVRDMGLKVRTRDRVAVDDRPVKPVARYTYLLYHKPRGLLCSRRDDRGRPLIYNSLDVAASVQSIGRLDMDSEGLLLLSDDGALARGLTRPGAGLEREYRVRVAGAITLDELEALRRGGLDIGRDETSDPWEVLVDSETRGHTWLTLTIRRGRWREVRRTLEKLGHPVRRLIRTRFGPIRLDPDMPPGAWRKLNVPEIRKLETAANEPIAKPVRGDRRPRFGPFPS